MNSRNIDGSTPLCEACGYGHTHIVEYLLSQGAMVNVPLLMFSPLHEAAIRGNFKFSLEFAAANPFLNFRQPRLLPTFD